MKNEIHVEGNTLYIETDKEVKKAEPLLENDDSELDYEYEEYNRNYPSDQIRIEKVTYSIFELSRVRTKGGKKSIVDAYFQRNNVWTRKQQIELIESVLIGLPLPLFYFSRNSEGTMIVVDGRQRLTSFYMFMNDEFQLKKLKYLPETYENKKFSELSALDQAKIEDFQVQAYLIVPPTPSRVLFDIFSRVNRAGTPLNKQEIRNAMYAGKSSVLLKKLAESSEFSNITNNAFAKDVRMKAQYLILRLISFLYWRQGRLNSANANYTFTNVDDLFSYMMRTINHFTDSEVSELQDGIVNGFKLFEQYFSSEVFRLSKRNVRSPINMNVFEVVMYMVIKHSYMNNKKDIKQLVSTLKEDSRFRKNLEKHRDTEHDILERFEIADSLLEEIKND